ncbi:methionine ABC transporter ATP-binding protein [Schaalia naturae]|uniref:Methionine ABC transporter ATP-binding protein n=1 Tax=Schaalia naturae TaxID=635203 RepID=A0ABW2SPJ0_9ACTO
MIDLQGVRKVYPVKGGAEVVALDDVTLHVERGSIHGIVGQSGAGKSTLIRCLTVLDRPTAGHIIVDGVDTTTLRGRDLRDARRRIGMVFQSANLLDARTAAGNIAYPLQVEGQKKEQIRPRVQELLDLVGLGDRGGSYPSQLSGGQRQRVGIARAMADLPKVLLCDEPTSALDGSSTRQILALLRQVRDTSGVTVVIITHEMGVVREICDSVTLLSHGRVVQTGTVQEVLSDATSPLARELVPAPSVEEADLRSGTTLLDVMFTSTPGVPTGASVLNLAASMGADVAAGTFESIGSTQVGRLALAVPDYQSEAILRQLRELGIHAEERAA